MSRVSVIGYRFVSDGAFSEKQRELILADPRVREVRPGPGWRRSLDDINNHGGDERDDRAGDQGRDPEQGGGSYTGCLAKLFPLGYLLFCRLLLIQIAKVGSFMKNSGNLLQDRHKNFEN